MSQRTPREEALARLKGIQDKFQGASGPIPADQMAAMFKEFTEGVVGLLGKEPVASARRMKFAGVGDARNQRADMLGALPKEVQVEMDKSVILGTLLRKSPAETKFFKRLIEESGEFKKAMDSLTANEGLEWVPTDMSPTLVEEVTQMGMVEQMHPHIAMPTQPYDIPIQIGRLVAYLATQQTADTGQTAVTKASAASTTNKLTLTAIDLAVEVLTSKHLEEDSIVAILPFLRGEVIKSLARGVEEAVVNGDTTASHQDSDVSSSTDRRKAWKGYRKHALANSYGVDFGAAGNAFDFETWLKVRAKHGKYGINPSDLYWLVGLTTFFKSLSLKDSGGHPIVTTVDKMGAGATVLTGVLGYLAGSPIAVSEFCREDLNASGAYDGVTATQGSILSIQKSGFVFGDRRDARIQLLDQLYAEYQQDALLCVIRKDFKPLRPIASNAAVAIGYNISLA